MIKVEVINRNFRIKDYDKIYNITRVDNTQPYNRMLIGDTFECDEEMCKYLQGKTEGQPLELVKILEVIPDKKVKKTTKKK